MALNGIITLLSLASSDTRLYNYKMHTPLQQKGRYWGQAKGASKGASKGIELQGSQFDARAGCGL